MMGSVQALYLGKTYHKKHNTFISSSTSRMQPCSLYLVEIKLIVFFIICFIEVQSLAATRPPPGRHPYSSRRTKFIIIYYFFVSPSAGRVAAGWRPALRNISSWWLSLHKSTKIIKKSMRNISSWWLSLGKSPKISMFKKFKNTKTILR